MNEWLGFGISIVVQLVVYAALVYQSGNFRQHLVRLPIYLLMGMFVGVALDYLLGSILGLWNYSLGFSLLFIALNGFFLWGLFIAEVATFCELSFLKFGLVCVAIGAISEFCNVYIGAWEWLLFENALFEYLVVIFLLYPAFGMTVAFCMKYREKPKVVAE